VPVLVTSLLRPGLLEGVSLLVVGSAELGGEPVAPELESLGQAVCETCVQLGSRVHAYMRESHALTPTAGEAGMDAAVASATSALRRIDMLVVDGAALFASGGLRSCVDGAWDATRAVVNLAFLPAEPTPSTRRILYLAPPSPGAGEQADAARAGLENLARTLSVEWARHGIAVVAIAPGRETAAGEVAALCAYLASPAGAYFSGALLDLRGP
jgi:citronellol/citronellal dehydrogenase